MKNNITVCFLEKTCLNKALFKKHNIEETSDPFFADYCFTQSVMKYPELIHKTVYLSREPFRSAGARWCYNHINNFKLAVMFFPESSNPKQIAFNDDSVPNWTYIPSVDLKINNRENTIIKNRGVFFAGNINAPEKDPEDGSTNINHIRKILGNHFLKNFSDTIMIGIGWDGQLKKVNNWRMDKLDRISKSNCDFVLALENTIMPNYMTEKIWDGFYSCKPTIYLGDPLIDKKIPKDCYIDLRPYYIPETKTIDLQGITNRIKNITQEEYDSIIKNSVKFIEKTREIKPKIQTEFNLKMINYVLSWGGS